MIKYHPSILDIESYYQDDNGDQYRRLVGGIGWPYGGQPAFAVVVAEDQSEVPQFKVLKGMEDHNALTLMETLKGVEVEYPVSRWYGCQTNRVMMQLLFEFNKGREQSGQFKFQGAPLAGEERNSGYYLPLILELGQVGKKRLTASASPKLYNALNNISPDTHLNRDVAEFPPLAALSYALAHLLTYKPVKPKVSVPEPYESSKARWQL